ncbi:MAG: hypothetical protein K2J37_05975 [Ruminococcus sp.]|nr:hypothetical protein [Ruminococcus sp.]MDE6784059.1 hypothetical protein [Ruminococcus sp.]
MAALTIRKPEIVMLNMTKIYCESCKITGVTTYYEEATASDYPYMTHKCKKAARVTFTGRIYDEEKPMRGAMNIANNNGYQINQIIYRGIKFENCVIVGFKIEDNGINYVTASVTVAVPNIIKFA